MAEKQDRFFDLVRRLLNETLGKLEMKSRVENFSIFPRNLRKWVGILEPEYAVKCKVNLHLYRLLI